MLQIKEIIQNLTTKYEGLVVTAAWGETGLFYNPAGRLARGIYFLTFKEHNGANDQASQLNREGIYRINFGITKATFVEMFGPTPARPPAGGVVEMGYDFSETGRLMPHPVYGWGAWVCILSPSAKTFTEIAPLIDEGYNLALQKYAKKKL